VRYRFHFLELQNFSDIFWMTPLMGFCQLSLFGGFAIYFPELFPTRLRSTGTSFCYNVGRLIAAVGPFALALLTSRVYAGTGEPMRYAGITMCSVFLLGLAVLPWALKPWANPSRNSFILATGCRLLATLLLHLSMPWPSAKTCWKFSSVLSAKRQWS